MNLPKKWFLNLISKGHFSFHAHKGLMVAIKPHLMIQSLIPARTINKRTVREFVYFFCAGSGIPIAK
jgi:hypothetical protein